MVHSQTGWLVQKPTGRQPHRQCHLWYPLSSKDGNGTFPIYRWCRCSHLTKDFKGGSSEPCLIMEGKYSNQNTAQYFGQSLYNMFPPTVLAKLGEALVGLQYDRQNHQTFDCGKPCKPQIETMTSLQCKQLWCGKNDPIAKSRSPQGMENKQIHCTCSTIQLIMIPHNIHHITSYDITLLGIHCITLLHYIALHYIPFQSSTQQHTHKQIPTAHATLHTVRKCQVRCTAFWVPGACETSPINLPQLKCHQMGWTSEN